MTRQVGMQGCRVRGLTKANKRYDLVLLPNRTHMGMFDGYTIKRTWGYFIEHLMRGDPVTDVTIVSRGVVPF